MPPSPRPAKPARSSRPSSDRVTFYIALLRGINVGGNHMIPMADLAALFAKAGCADVQTYIQSGNVLFRAAPACARDLPEVVAQRIQKRFGFAAPIVIRSAAELDAIAGGHPLLPARPSASAAGDAAATDSEDPVYKLLHVGFLALQPEPQRVARLDPQRSPHDRFVVRGREVYVHYGGGAGGVAGTRLTSAYFDSTLGTTVTFRNWRTVLKLAELARGIHG